MCLFLVFSKILDASASRIERCGEPQIAHFWSKLIGIINVPNFDWLSRILSQHMAYKTQRNLKEYII